MKRTASLNIFHSYSNVGVCAWVVGSGFGPGGAMTGDGVNPGTTEMGPTTSDLV